MEYDFSSDIIKIKKMNIDSSMLNYRFLPKSTYKKYLVDNPHKTSKVYRFKNEMANGKWMSLSDVVEKKLRYSPIIFFNYGMLFEGKHRIIALSTLPSDIIIEFAVIVGWPHVKNERFLHTKEWLSWRNSVSNSFLNGTDAEVLLEIPLKIRNIMDEPLV